MVKRNKMTLRRMAFIAGGWHYPRHFYEMIASQNIPEGWKIDLFCIGHREPPGLQYEKQEIWDKENNGKLLYELDRILYREFVTKNDLKRLGFRYLLEKNTMGDFEFLNQWLKRYNWLKYDIIGISHDDNLIINKNLFFDILTDRVSFYQKDPRDGIKNIPATNKNWLILSHAAANSYYHIRCTLDFFKRKTIKLAGGRFDSSSIKLTRDGEINTPTSHSALLEWNKWTDIMIKFIENNKIKKRVKYISPFYRISPYCIEGERGFIHRVSWAGDQFIQGVNWLVQNGVIRLVQRADV